MGRVHCASWCGTSSRLLEDSCDEVGILASVVLIGIACVLQVGMVYHVGYHPCNDNIEGIHMLKNKKSL